MAMGARRGPLRLHIEVGGEARQVTVEPVAGDTSRVAVSWDGTRHVVDVAAGSGALSMILAGPPRASHEVTCHETAPGELALGIDGLRVTALVNDGRRSRTVAAEGAAGEHAVLAPMPGRVVRVLVAEGDTVRRGQGVAVVEAMKMENELPAPVDGVVSGVRAAADDSVEAGAVLVVVNADIADDGH